MKTVLVRLLVKKPDEPVGVDAAVEAMAEAAADMGGLFRGASATPQVDTKCMAYVELHVHLTLFTPAGGASAMLRGFERFRGAG